MAFERWVPRFAPHPHAQTWASHRGQFTGSSGASLGPVQMWSHVLQLRRRFMLRPRRLLPRGRSAHLSAREHLLGSRPGWLSRGADEGIKHDCPPRCAGEDARLYEVRWEGGEVGLGVGTGGDTPNVANIVGLLIEPVEELREEFLWHIPDGALVAAERLLLLLRHRVPAVVEAVVATPVAALLVLALALLLWGAASKVLSVRRVLRTVRACVPCGLPDRLSVIEVARRLAQQEEVLVG